MQTRSELHKQEEPVTVSDPSHHVGFRLIGILLLTLFTVSLIFNQTFLNKKFVTRELTSSTVETQLLDEVHAGMSQYGLPAKLLTKSAADHLVRTAVNQAFAGQQLKLDLSPVTDQLAGQADSQLAQFGISTSMLPAGTSDAITSNVNSAVNSRINTPEVTAFINGLKVTRTVVNIIMVVSAAGVLLLLVLSLFGRHLIKSFSWITTGALGLSGAVVAIIRTAIPQLAQANPDYSSFAVQCADDFQGVAWTWLIVLAVLAIVFWGVRLIYLLLSSRH